MMQHNDVLITKLDSLITRLDSCSRDDYASLEANLDITGEALEPYASWSMDRYTRNCIKRTEHYELILLCWEKGQSTPIHCHGGEECWVYVVEGQIKERQYGYEDEELSLANQDDLAPGEQSFMCDDMGYHTLTNSHDGRTMTLHLYMDPIDQCTIYNSKTEDFRSVDLSYDTYAGVHIAI